MDVITGALLFFGLVLLLLGIFKATKNSQVVAIVGIIMFLIGGISYIGLINFGGFGGGAVKPFTGAQSGQFIAPPHDSSVSECSINAVTSNGKSQADILIRNVENASLGYLTGTVSANSGGAFIDSVTANAGSSASYASMSNIPNCAKGELVVTLTTGTGLASSKRLRDVEKNQLVSGYDFNDRSVHKYEILSASTDVANLLARTSTLTGSSNGNVNGTEAATAISGTGTVDGSAYYANTSLGSKGTINFYIDVQVNGTSSVHGQYDEADGVVISYDTGTAARFSRDSLSLQVDQPAGFSLNKVSASGGGCGLNDVVTNRNVEACWSVPTMKSGALYRIRGTLTADLGDPLSSDTAPRICFDDRVSFRDTDGSVKYQSFSTSGTNQGVGGNCLIFVLA